VMTWRMSCHTVMVHLMSCAGYVMLVQSVAECNSVLQYVAGHVQVMSCCGGCGMSCHISHLNCMWCAMCGMWCDMSHLKCHDVMCLVASVLSHVPLCSSQEEKKRKADAWFESQVASGGANPNLMPIGYSRCTHIVS